MRILVVILAIVAAVFGVLYWQSAPPQRTVVPVESLVVTQLVERPAITTEVERTVTVMVTNTLELETKVTGLETNLAQVTEALHAEEEKAAALDKQKGGLLIQLGATSNELVHVQRQYAVLKTRSDATEDQLRKIQGEKESLEMEIASLERQLNNLDDLRTQMRLVKKELWAKKVAEWKQSDAAAAVGGNRGYLMLRGKWTESPTNQPPQN